MAFGFSPKHIQEFKINNINKHHFLVLAIEAAHQLNWDVSFKSETGFIAYTKFSLSSFSEEVTVKIDNDTAHIKSECTGTQFLDWGKNKDNVEALISKIKYLKNHFSEEEIAEKHNAISQDFASTEEDVLSKPPSTSREKITNFLSIFKPTEGYFVTPILININLLVFIVMIISGVNIFIPENQDLVNWGANFKPITLEGQWWRLFTACFLHIGILHLLFNMYALLYVGLLLEPYLGKARFIAAYFLSGITASLVSLWWNDAIISAGASGAIFGMYGVFLALLTSNLLDKSVKNALMTSIVVFVGYNLLNGLKPNSGIDNAAHIGGLLSGMAIGYAFIPSLKQFKNKNLKFGIIGGLSVAVILLTSFVCLNLPNDLGKYDEKMEAFSNMENMALEVYNLPENTPKEKILYAIKDRGIYYWEENLKLLNELKDLDLPTDYHERNEKLKEYCKLRIKNYELLYKTIAGNTNKHEAEIMATNQKIEALINELSNQQ